MRKLIVIAVVLLAIALSLTVFHHRKEPSIDPLDVSPADPSLPKDRPEEIMADGPSDPASAKASPAGSTDPRVLKQPNGTVWLRDSIERSRALNQSDSVSSDLVVVESLIADYRRVFKENPVGENEEIVAALLGENTKRLVFLNPEHAAIEKGGILVDRYGSPFRFHALSGTRMEVSSAGEDRVLWTEDDVNIKSEMISH